VLNFALRNVIRQKLRSAMILAAIAFGVAGLILIGGFIQDMFAQLAEATIHSQTGHVQLARPGYFGAGSRSPERFLIPGTDSLKRRIASSGEVQDVMARMRFSGLLNNGKTDLPIVGEGIEPDKEIRLGTYIVIKQGRLLRDKDAYGIEIGEGVAKSLRLHLGDRVNLLVTTADGAINVLDFVVVGVFQSFSRDYDAHAVKIPLAAAQELLATNGANVIVVALHRTADTDAVAAKIRTDIANAQLDVRKWYEIDDFYGKAVTLYERQFGVLRLIVLIMILLSVSNVLNMSIFERAGEFGTMRALGIRSKHVFRSVVLEGFLMGLGGAVAGCLLGVFLAWAISAIGIPMPPPPGSNLEYIARIRVTPAVVTSAFLVGLVGTTLASVLPALRVSRLPIADALRSLM
jgi:putative ABC transport system permease protein